MVAGGGEGIPQVKNLQWLFDPSLFVILLRMRELKAVLLHHKVVMTIHPKARPW